MKHEPISGIYWRVRNTWPSLLLLAIGLVISQPLSGGSWVEGFKVLGGCLLGCLIGWCLIAWEQS